MELGCIYLFVWPDYFAIFKKSEINVPSHINMIITKTSFNDVIIFLFVHQHSAHQDKCGWLFKKFEPLNCQVLGHAANVIVHK